MESGHLPEAAMVPGLNPGRILRAIDLSASMTRSVIHLSPRCERKRKYSMRRRRTLAY